VTITLGTVVDGAALLAAVSVTDQIAPPPVAPVPPVEAKSVTVE